MEPKKYLVIFASGAGTNAKKIIEHFENSPVARVTLIVCNKKGAGVTEIAKANGIPVLLIEKERFFEGDAYVEEIRKAGANLIILAGFLWKIPRQFIAAFPNAILNIHPALLPKFGGKGMYGDHVHQRVINEGEAFSGITIHYVDEHYDNGDIVFQARCNVSPDDTPASLAQKIHQLEHGHYAKVIEELILKNGRG